MKKEIKWMWIILGIIIILGVVLFGVNYKNKRKYITNVNDIVETTNNENRIDTIEQKNNRTKIEDLPQKYNMEKAIQDKCVISVHGQKLYNKNELDNFITKVNNNKVAFVRCIGFTDEGDIIITDADYDGRSTIKVCKDLTRDRFSSEKDRTYKYKTYSKLEIEKENKYVYIKLENNNEYDYLISYSEDAENINSTDSISTALTLDDEIKNDTIWCGTFQLIWNDLKNDLAKQDIKFSPQLKVVENLNKESFRVNDITDKYYYKKIGIPSLALKQEIENGIKEKFNETSDILDDFEWEDRNPLDYFLYVMLKKEFQFKKEFEEFENGKFGEYENVKYFGIKNDETEELQAQVKVLYYNSKNDFAIKLLTKQEDEVILCKNPEGKTFNEIYENIKQNKQKYKGKTYTEEGELLKIPNIKVNEKKEFTEIENKSFYFSNGREYSIEKAIQTIKFELDKKGGKIKSEAGMMAKNETAMAIDEIREFVIDDTFAIFLQEKGKDKPYFAGKINDITKFQ